MQFRKLARLSIPLVFIILANSGVFAQTKNSCRSQEEQFDVVNRRFKELGAKINSSSDCRPYVHDYIQSMVENNRLADLIVKSCPGYKTAGKPLKPEDASSAEAQWRARCEERLPQKIEITPEGRFIEAQGIQITGIDHVRNGRPMNKQTYNRAWLNFSPADFKSKRVNISSFSIMGTLGRGWMPLMDCPVESQGVEYEWTGNSHKELECRSKTDSAKITSVKYDSMFSHYGETHKLASTGNVTVTRSESRDTYNFMENVEFVLGSDGTCRLINYRLVIENSGTASDRQGKVDMTTIQSEVGARCDYYKYPRRN